uniref:Putative secreted protein n=1 Tax=Anopheles marajoara TaxID=58244 RepID=A0A2M4C621_9DIPT
MADWGRLFAVPAKAAAAAAAAAPAPAAASFPQPYCVTAAATEAADVLLAAAALAAAAVWQARFVSSWVMRSSIRYCATLIAFGWPVMVTIRLRVPGAKMPFFEIWIFAPDICWISTKLRPAGLGVETKIKAARLFSVGSLVGSSWRSSFLVHFFTITIKGKIRFRFR